MPIVLARIDERLIHGQIMCSPALVSLGVNRLIIVDPLIRDNPIMQCVYDGSTQTGDCQIEEVAYLDSHGLGAFLAGHDGPKARYLVIFRDLGQALGAAREGISLPPLNLGIYTSKDPRKRALTSGFSVGPSESEALNELHKILGALYFDGLGTDASPYSPSEHSWRPS
ncbi:MAG: PTS sugar transporter subunit IIB [Deltaproteobacteria bacterium]|jgi:mannose/fructose/N-acetylgalactosamine-specific phosphotransferase system component IIB|nr:PTS sugar transporter subunit IIB [Deltaproteobacteria bacterium]